MRILHIVGTVSPAAGGPTEVIRMLIRYAPPGYSSELATLDDPAAPFLRDLPFPVHAFGSSRARWFRPALLRWLRKNRGRFDGVIVHGLWEFTGLAAMLASAKHPGYVVFTHGMLDPYFRRAFPAKHAKKWLYWLPAEYWVLRRAKRVLFTTAAERDLAARSFWLYRWRAMVVPIGSEAPPRRFGLARNRIRGGLSRGCRTTLSALPGAHQREEGMRSAGAGIRGAKGPRPGSASRDGWTGSGPLARAA